MFAHDSFGNPIWPDALGGAPLKVTINGKPIIRQAHAEQPAVVRTDHDRRKSRIAYLYSRDGQGCYWCGIELLKIESLPCIRDGRVPHNYPTIDHVVPLSLGGSRRSLENLVVSCLNCNQDRGNTLGPPKWLGALVTG